MAQFISLEYFGDGPEAKKRLTPKEVERLSTPGIDVQFIAWEDECEAVRMVQRYKAKLMRFAQREFSPRQYQVFLYILAIEKKPDAVIAQELHMNENTVQTYRCECKRRLREAQANGDFD